MNMPSLNGARPGAGKIDLAKSDEVRVGRLEHVHDLAALVGNLLQRNNFYPIYHPVNLLRGCFFLLSKALAPPESFVQSILADQLADPVQPYVSNPGHLLSLQPVLMEGQVQLVGAIGGGPSRLEGWEQPLNLGEIGDVCPLVRRLLSDVLDVAAWHHRPDDLSQVANPVVSLVRADMKNLIVDSLVRRLHGGNEQIG